MFPKCNDEFHQFITWIWPVNPITRTCTRFLLFADAFPQWNFDWNKATLWDLIAATGLVILFKLDSNHRFLACKAFKFVGWPKKNKGWPWKRIGHLSGPMPYHALCIIPSPYVNSNWSYDLETAKLGFNLRPWPFAWKSLLSMVITPESLMTIRWWEHNEKGVTERRVDRRMDWQTDWTIHKAAWSQLKMKLGHLIENKCGYQVYITSSLSPFHGTASLCGGVCFRRNRSICHFAPNAPPESCWCSSRISWYYQNPLYTHRILLALTAWRSQKTEVRMSQFI